MQFFRGWLADHYASETEVWLIYYKKHSGQPRIPYDHAVEEALCFGWIDSLVKRIDDEKFAQKFTPRRDGSQWSALNQRRVRKLIEEGRMTEHPVRFTLTENRMRGDTTAVAKSPFS